MDALYSKIRLTVESFAEFCFRDFCLSEEGEALSAAEIRDCVSSEGYVEGDGYCFSCIEYALGQSTKINFEMSLVSSTRPNRKEIQNWDTLLFDPSFLSGQQESEGDWRLYNVVLTLKDPMRGVSRIISPPLEAIRVLYENEILSGILPIGEDEELLLP